jgi:hypothetical protein
MLLSDQLVNKLCEPGHEAVAALPASEVDTVTDAGLAGAFKDPRLSLMLPTHPHFAEWLSRSTA